MISPLQRPLPDNTQHSQQTNIHAARVGYEPTISAGERPKTYALDRAATGTDIEHHYKLKLLVSCGEKKNKKFVILVVFFGLDILALTLQEEFWMMVFFPFKIGW